MSGHRDDIARIDIHKESLHFSCAHFTIFSQDHRENLHGHNYVVSATVTGPIDQNGLCFDYNELKNVLQEICDELDETTLLAQDSPYLKFEEQNPYVTVVFGSERMPFLKRDIMLLPVRNITVEELARWILCGIRKRGVLRRLPIDELELSISSGPGQVASVKWSSE